MKFAQSFEVSAAIEDVWELLIDLERVAPCLPGAAIGERDDAGAYHGSFQVKLGPTTAGYRGQIVLEEVDRSTHTATLKAHGSERRGQGGASATIVNTLVAIDGGTRVQTVTDLTITGRLARFGRGGMIEDVSDRLLRDFAGCLQQRLAAAAVGVPDSVVVAPDAAPVVAPPGLTAAEAVASAGAEVRPEDSAAEGRSPAELDPDPAAAPGPAPVPPAPVHGIRLLLHAWGQRLRRWLGGGRR